ncbi:isocitrate lyase/phosphoenolpyruvate mutase family protein [Nonomuraea sp. NPDC049400]|uniref:isocitrate lyase/phosphoenolpyruvate mutase family protein n=1 Tax=Nonomuraea sp. NPDC049400 TaxID=3364352 RepID=UPI0037A23B22
MGVYSVRERLANVSRIAQVTSSPIILDADTSGEIEHLQLTVPMIETAGVSAIVIEDKTGVKRNSLIADHAVHRSAEPFHFAAKIAAAKSAQRRDSLMVFARMESLILRFGMDDALRRAFCYVDAGADGIMIHSKHCSPAEVVDFARQFRCKFLHVPLIAVPTTYSSITAAELFENGFSVVVYANQQDGRIPRSRLWPGQPAPASTPLNCSILALSDEEATQRERTPQWWRSPASHDSLITSTDSRQSRPLCTAQSRHREPPT